MSQVTTHVLDTAFGTKEMTLALDQLASVG